MAGAAVFGVAKSSSAGFALFTLFQAWMVKFVPSMLLSQMFSGTCDREKAMLSDEESRAVFIHGLRETLLNNRASYKQTIREYVGPWATILNDVRCDTVIYHGANDMWAPLAMAEALQANLPNGANLTIIPNGGHYTTLQEALPTALGLD